MYLCYWMKTSFLHKTFALSMAFLLLFSTVGFSVNVHFCQGKLSGVSILKQASCCSAKTSCNHSVKKSNKGCCENKTIIKQASKEDFNKTQQQKVELSQFAVAFIYAYCILPIQVKLVKPYALHKPPLPDKDFSVLYQSFLIWF